MSKKSDMYLTAQNRQERLSLAALQQYLDPCIVTSFDARDDFGRDGIIQFPEIKDGRLIISSLTVIFQSKSTAKGFKSTHSESIETRHLNLWTEQYSSPILVIVWSAESNSFRFRMAQDIVEELDAKNPIWRHQEEVVVHFREHEAFESSMVAISHIRRKVIHANDHLGGINRIHGSVRKIVITNLIRGTAITSQELTTNAVDDPENIKHMIVGMGWTNNDLDSIEVLPDNVLSSSLMLFEEVWCLCGIFSFCIDSIGEKKFINLLQRGRIKLYSSPHKSSFTYKDWRLGGSIETFTMDYVDPVLEELERISNGKYKIGTLKNISEFVRNVSSVDAQVIEGIVKEDLKKSNLRSLLGLRKSIKDTEPVWDGVILNRLFYINYSRHLANYLRADVIQYDSGASRVASEKDYDLFGLNRLFDSSKTFDILLRKNGIPDLSQLLNYFSFSEIVDIADSDAAQEFRDWFWTIISKTATGQSDLTSIIVDRISSLTERDFEITNFPKKLKLKFIENIIPQIISSSAEVLKSPGFASTSLRANEAIQRQRENHHKYRIQRIQLLLGKTPNAYGLCPCDSGEKYKFCCGASPD